MTTWEKQISTMKTFAFVGIVPCLLLDVGLCVGNFDNESFLAYIFFINSIFNYANLYEQKPPSKHQKIPLLHLLPPLFQCQIYRCKCWYLPLTPLLESDKFLQIPFPVLCQSYSPEKKIGCLSFLWPSRKHAESFLLLQNQCCEGDNIV